MTTNELADLTESQSADQAADDEATDDYLGNRTDDRSGVISSLGPDGIDILSSDDEVRGGNPGSHAPARRGSAERGSTAGLDSEFTVWRKSTPDHLLEVCRVCDEALPLPADPCEFAGQPRIKDPVTYRDQPNGLPFRFVQYTPGEPVLRSGYRRISKSAVPVATVLPGRARKRYKCQCSGCQTRRRRPGNQPETCGRDECNRELARRQKARKRAQKVRVEVELARDWLDAYPDATNHEVMEWSGIATEKRIKEAREP